MARKEYYAALSKMIEFRDGKPYWIVNRPPNVKIGDESGYIDTRGYRMIGLKLGGEFQQLSAHRLCFFINSGRVPNIIDHVNRIKDDNRIKNLRECTRMENSRNMGTQSNNKSGYKGVSPSGVKFQCHINIGKKQIYLGTFKCKNEAARVYNFAARMHHGKFAYTNIIKEENINV